jgi:hypothetical protein
VLNEVGGGSVTKKFVLALVFVILVVVGSVVSVVGGPDDGLRAELKIESLDAGLPGITKAYEAELVNRSFWPIRVQYCDFVSDNMSRREEVAYAVERWDGRVHEWKPSLLLRGDDFCRPDRPGMIRAKWTSELLWPGQVMSTGEEVPSARNGFQVGDRARFVIFAASGNHRSAQIATPEFVIDENRAGDQLF